MNGANLASKEQNVKICNNENKTFSYEEALSASIEYFKGDELAAKVFVDKYALRDLDQRILEKTPDYMHRRIAREFARIEKNKFKNPLTEEHIFELLSGFNRIVPQGSPMYGIGNKFQFISLSNCYVVDSPLDSYGSIMEADENLVQISKRRGGVGIDVSHLRPSGAPTKNAARTSTGVVSFAERYSNSIREVGQAGRRGALMVTLSVHHPDILEFAKVKRDLSKVTGANISIRLTDEFLKAVDSNSSYEQRWPVDSTSPSISKMVDAKSVWNVIVENAHYMAEPGLLFWDNIISESPADCYSDVGFKTISTNPCCFAKDSDVYVMTKNGVKEIKSINKEDKIFINQTGEWASTSGYFNAGKAEVFDVYFKNGDKVTITSNHKLCKISSKRNGRKIIHSEGNLIELKDLKVGDKIAIHTENINGIRFASNGTKEEGIVMGFLSGDGCLSYHDDRQSYPSTILTFWQHEFDAAEIALDAMKKMKYNVSLVKNTVNKTRSIKSCKFTEDFVNKYNFNIWKFKSSDLANDFLFNCSEDFLKGFLSAYFTADGTVNCNHNEKSYALQLSSINKKMLEQIRQIILMFGIKSSIGIARKAGESEFKNGGKYATKDCYRLSITGAQNIMRFKESIGFFCSHKQNRLNSICEKYKNIRTPKCNNYTEITDIVYAGIKEVGCIEVDKWHKFTANGIISGNSEIPLSAFDSCRLMLLNAFIYVDSPFTKKANFNFEKFNQDAEICQRLMDDLVDLEIECVDRILAKIQKDPESVSLKSREIDLWNKIKKAALDGRRTGTGATAIGDALAALGIPYASNEGISMTEKIYKNLKLSAYRSSVSMAKEIGPFPIWDHKKEKDNPFIERIKEEDPDLYHDMKKYGRRNIALLTTAPAGSVSILTQTSSGIEPQFMIDPYIRRKKGNPGDIGFRTDFVDQNGDHWMEFKVYPPKVKMWMEITGKSDLNESPWRGSTAPELDWKKRVRLQSLAQKHLDHAISSTLNLPNDVSIESVDEIYRTAWKSGCKGITIYRDGCRTGVLVAESSSKKNDNEIVNTKAPKRPSVLKCEVHHVTVKNKPYFVIIGILKDKPYEVFASENTIEDSDMLIPKNFFTGTLTKEARGHYRADLFDKHGNTMVIKKIGDKLSEDEAALTRIISTALRHGADVQFIVHQLEKVEGHMFGFSKSISRSLKKYIPDGTEVTGETCSSCNTQDACALVRQEGCVMCKSCGWSKCG
jgi:ribonucleotide reductase alpha subunit